jgi:hypothetical protein
MHGIKDQYNMSMNIGGVDYPCMASNIENISVFENYATNLPTLNITIMDDSGIFVESTAGGDGTPIQLVFGDGGREGESSSSWVITGNPEISHAKGYYRIKINAVLNNIAYMRKIANGLYEGSSNTALSKLAGEAGLKFNGDSASDSQVWLPNNKTLAGFARMIAGHAYGGSQSVYALGVTIDGELRFKDLSKIQGGKQIGGQGLQILSWDITSKGAIGNHNRAAGSTSAGYKPDGVLKELKEVSTTLGNGKLSFSSFFKGAIGDFGGKLDKLPRDSGNSHEKYQEARYQNSRLRAMYSLDLHVLVNTFSGLNVLSGANINLPDIITSPNSTGVNKSYSGNYIVSAKTTTLINSSYYERITFTTQEAGG